MKASELRVFRRLQGFPACESSHRLKFTSKQRLECLGLSDPDPKLGLHQSIDLLGRFVKARPDQQAITHQERE
jgi:hypothetical protein